MRCLQLEHDPSSYPTTLPTHTHTQPHASPVAKGRLPTDQPGARSYLPISLSPSTPHPPLPTYPTDSDRTHGSCLGRSVYLLKGISCFAELITTPARTFLVGLTPNYTRLPLLAAILFPWEREGQASFRGGTLLRILACQERQLQFTLSPQDLFLCFFISLFDLY